MSLTTNHETPHNALWYTTPGSTKPTVERANGTSKIPSLTPQEYVDLIRHRYRHNNA